VKIAIDGPAGAGKSTVARALAQRLGFVHLDSGALYRALAWVALREGVDLGSGADLAHLLATCRLAPLPDGVSVEGVALGEALKTPQVDAAVSQVAWHPAVRSEMVRIQRQWGEGRDLVADGRDIGTVVWPEAEVKIFLTATLAARAERRAAEQPGLDLAQVEEEIARRDEKDSARSVGPLRVADGARLVDTTALTVEEVVDRLVELVRPKP
jgi:cytidylate kinase